MVLLLDNYDSFTWNLAHRLGELGAEVQVVRNDAMTVDEIAARRPTHLVISPGPGRPETAGISVDDLFYDFDGAVDTHWDMVTGPVFYSYETWKIEPRAASDLQ